MSSIDQTHKEYLAHQNGTVYWPFTAWDAIAGKPDDLAHKSDIPDITPLAKQVDLSLVEQYGLPRNYWIVKNQTAGYSFDSAGNPTVANNKAQTSELIKYDSAIQMVFVGWGAKLNDQMTVAYFDKDKKYLSSTIWTITSEGNGDNPRSNIEFYKYAANNAAYIRINCNYGANAKTMIVSSVFENADWVPALEDLKTGTDVNDLSNNLSFSDENWTLKYDHADIKETRLTDTDGFLNVHLVASNSYGPGQKAATSWENVIIISGVQGVPTYSQGLVNSGNSQGTSSLNTTGLTGSFFISSYDPSQQTIKMGCIYPSDIAAGIWRSYNATIPLKYS